MTSDTPPKPPVRQGRPEVFVMRTGRNVLPAAPSAAPSVTFTSAIVHRAGTAGEAADADDEDSAEADDDAEVGSEEEVDADDGAEELLSASDDASSVGDPQPASSVIPVASAAAASAVIFTPGVSRGTGRNAASRGACWVREGGRTRTTRRGAT
jgi:hypothetical protein